MAENTIVPTPTEKRPIRTDDAHTYARAVLSDDEMARNAVAYDLRRILSVLAPDDAEKQRTALKTLRDAAANNQIDGGSFWDSYDGCGCAIGTLCMALDIDAETTVWNEAGDAFKEQFGKRPTWYELIRAGNLTGRRHETDDTTPLFTEVLLNLRVADRSLTETFWAMYQNGELDVDPIDAIVRPGIEGTRYYTKSVHGQRAVRLVREEADALLTELDRAGLIRPWETLTPAPTESTTTDETTR